MLHRLMLLYALVLVGFGVARVAYAETPAHVCLQAHLQVGEHPSHVFSRTISIKGRGF